MIVLHNSVLKWCLQFFRSSLSLKDGLSKRPFSFLGRRKNFLKSIKTIYNCNKISRVIFSAQREKGLLFNQRSAFECQFSRKETKFCWFATYILYCSGSQPRFRPKFVWVRKIYNYMKSFQFLNTLILIWFECLLWLIICTNTQCIIQIFKKTLNVHWRDCAMKLTMLELI